jgi:hypothetical protein
MMGGRIVRKKGVWGIKRNRRSVLTTDCFGQARAMTRFFRIDLIVEITADVVVETGACPVSMHHILSLEKYILLPVLQGY